MGATSHADLYFYVMLPAGLKCRRQAAAEAFEARPRHKDGDCRSDRTANRVGGMNQTAATGARGSTKSACSCCERARVVGWGMRGRMRSKDIHRTRKMSADDAVRCAQPVARHVRCVRRCLRPEKVATSSAALFATVTMGNRRLSTLPIRDASALRRWRRPRPPVARRRARTRAQKT